MTLLRRDCGGQASDTFRPDTVGRLGASEWREQSADFARVKKRKRTRLLLFGIAPETPKVSGQVNPLPSTGESPWRWVQN